MPLPDAHEKGNRRRKKEHGEWERTGNSQSSYGGVGNTNNAEKNQGIES